MKKVTYTVLSLLLLASAAFGQGGPISGFTELTDTATSDELAIVDKSATPPATGTTKRITVANLLKLLHGDLDVNDFAIVSTGAGDIDITPDTTGNVVLDGIYWPQSDGTEGQWITTDASAQLSFTSDLWHIEDFAFRAISGEKTVSSGVLTVTETYTRVGGEGDSADIVDTITQTGATDGQVLILGITSEPITFADGTTGGDNLDLGADVLLDSVNERLILQFNGTNWVQLANSANIETVEDTETWIIAASDETSDLTTGEKIEFRAPYACTITEVRASLTTAATGATFIADIHVNGTSIMTTDKLDIEVSEFTTLDAATQPAVTSASIADDDVINIEIDQVGSTVAGAGLKVYIEHTRD